MRGGKGIVVFLTQSVVHTGNWDSMEEYTCMIPRETQEGAFYRAALALHQNHFQQAQAVSGTDLVFIDTTLYFYNYSNERLRYTV